jgi:hypothetical protein
MWIMKKIDFKIYVYYLDIYFKCLVILVKYVENLSKINLVIKHT